MRKKLFEIVEKAEYGDVLSHIYDSVMIVTILFSLIPLAFKEELAIFTYVEWGVTAIFILDYFLRWLTADYKVGKGKLSFLLYPFTLMAIIDVLSILPSLVAVNEAFRALRAVRLIRALRVFKIFKGVRYSKSFSIIVTVFQKQKRSLMTVGGLAIGYILVSALVVFNVEPETFASFFDAVYWATVSLTTVGYGDIYAVSEVGKIVTMISSVLGVAIVALPAGIITAGYMTELNQSTKENEEKSE